MLMARRLLIRNQDLDTVISSTALRALGIAKPVAISLSTRLTEDSSLYTFSSRALKRQLFCPPNAYQRVAFVSHNPAITQIAACLSTQPIDNISTSGVVTFNCDINHWHELTKNVCRMDYFDYPKKLSS
ncbi:MAG: phosphohistidine phosphatase SixA [Cellvibrionaceae bacterium]|jgi:phosphohistidine phosphatase SixA